MEYRNLGSSGLRVSTVGLGCNNFGQRIDASASRLVINRALDLGITLFDTADVYSARGGSETVLGEVLGPRRNDIVLATKFGMAMDDSGERQGAARRYIVRALEDSLRRLRTDHIDLYQQHTFDSRTPLEETLRALEDLQQSGKVLYVGCSNFPAWRVTEAHFIAQQAGLRGFVSCQDEYSLLARGIEKELLPAAGAWGLGLLPYFPLANGLLSGKYGGKETRPVDATRLALNDRLRERYFTPHNLAVVAELDAFVKARGRTVLDLAFSWLARRPQVASVIAGATSAAQVEQNVIAAGWALSADEMAEVDRITTPA